MDLLINLLITLAILAVAFFYFNQRIRQALKAENLLKEVEKEVQALMRDLNQTASRNIDLLEDRIAKIEGLLTDTDRKIVLLSKESEKRSDAAKTYSHLMKTGKSVVAVAPAAPEALPLFPDGPEEPTPQPLAAPEAPRKTTRERVLDMRRQGFSSELISSRLGITLAEVELIVSLHGGGL